MGYKADMVTTAGILDGTKGGALTLCTTPYKNRGAISFSSLVRIVFNGLISTILFLSTINYSVLTLGMAILMHRVIIIKIHWS